MTKKLKIYEIIHGYYQGPQYVEADSMEDALDKFRRWDNEQYHDSYYHKNECKVESCKLAYNFELIT